MRGTGARLRPAVVRGFRAERELAHRFFAMSVAEMQLHHCGVERRLRRGDLRDLVEYFCGAGKKAQTSMASLLRPFLPLQFRVNAPCKVRGRFQN